MRRQRLDPLAIELDRALARFQLAANEIEQRSLAGPVRPNEAQDLAALHRERDAIHRHEAGEAARRLIDAKDLRAHRLAPKRRQAASTAPTTPRLRNSAAITSTAPSTIRWPPGISPPSA